MQLTIPDGTEGLLLKITSVKDSLWMSVKIDGELTQRGFVVTGIDFNEDYIALAKHLAEWEAVHAEFMIGDMREIPYVGQFDAIINVGTSFGFFDDEADNQQVLQAVAKALKPKGIFLLEMGNPDRRLKYFVAKEWQKREDGDIVIIQREFDCLRSRINTAFELLRNGKPSEKWSHLRMLVGGKQINRNPVSVGSGADAIKNKNAACSRK